MEWGKIENSNVNISREEKAITERPLNTFLQSAIPSIRLDTATCQFRELFHSCHGLSRFSLWCQLFSTVTLKRKNPKSNFHMTSFISHQPTRLGKSQQTIAADRASSNGRKVLIRKIRHSVSFSTLSQLDSPYLYAWSRFSIISFFESSKPSGQRRNRKRNADHTAKWPTSCWPLSPVILSSGRPTGSCRFISLAPQPSIAKPSSKLWYLYSSDAWRIQTAQSTHCFMLSFLRTSRKASSKHVHVPRTILTLSFRLITASSSVASVAVVIRDVASHLWLRELTELKSVMEII